MNLTKLLKAYKKRNLYELDQLSGRNWCDTLVTINSVSNHVLPRSIDRSNLAIDWLEFCYAFGQRAR